jgi:hypothetical protein
MISSKPIPKNWPSGFVGRIHWQSQANNLLHNWIIYSKGLKKILFHVVHIVLNPVEPDATFNSMHLFSACVSEHMYLTQERERERENVVTHYTMCTIDTRERERECCHSLYHVECTAFCDMLWTYIYCTLLLIIHNNFGIGKREIQQSPFEYFEIFNIEDKIFSFFLFNRRCLSL